jgi:hypothetical protein
VIKEFVKMRRRMVQDLLLENCLKINDPLVAGHLRRSELVVTLFLLISFADIFFRLLVEGLLASERAEVIGLSFVFGRACRGGGINVHVADGIVNSGGHWLVSLLIFSH